MKRTRYFFYSIIASDLISFASNCFHFKLTRQRSSAKTNFSNTFAWLERYNVFRCCCDFCSTHEKCTKYIVLWFNLYIVVYFPKYPLYLERVRVRGHNPGVSNIFWFFLSMDKRNCHRLGYARMNPDANAQFSSHPWDPCIKPDWMEKFIGDCYGEILIGGSWDYITQHI